MVRHLRLQNGIANGNRLTLIGPDELGRWPAHTRGAACQYSEHFELTPVIAGTEELFDFMGSEDVHDLPSSPHSSSGSVALRLSRILPADS